MSDSNIVPQTPTNSILSKISTYEDYLSAYIQIDQANSSASWFKADLLLQMVKKLGENAVKKLAEDVKQPTSTIINYTRVALAFPPDKRDEGASFSLHFQASFADSLDEKDHNFDGEKRFKWLDKAIDENMSTRKLAEKIQTEKMGITTNETAEDQTMIKDAQRAVYEVRGIMDKLLKEVKRERNKEAYFEIVRIHQAANVRRS